jgi:hypothetical protein
MGGMKLALCVFVAALTCATAAKADVANDKVCILATLNFLKETPPVQIPEMDHRRVPLGFSGIQSVSVLAATGTYETAPPVTSRVVELLFESPYHWRWAYICRTQPSRRPVVEYLYDASTLTE